MEGCIGGMKVGERDDDSKLLKDEIFAEFLQTSLVASQ